MEPFEEPTFAEGGYPEDSKTFRPKFPIIVSLFSALAIIILSLGSLFFQREQPKLTPPPLPTPTIPPFIPPFSATPSAWATEAGVLKIEEDLRNLESDLGITDLSESSLSLPILDMNVNFEK